MSAVAIFALVCVVLLLGFLAGYATGNQRAEERHQYELAEIEDAERERAYEANLRARWSR